MSDSPDPDAIATLNRLLLARLGAQGRDWLAGELARIRTAADPEQALMRSYAAAGRTLGDTTLGGEGAALATGCGLLDASRWGLGDAGRACLLAAATGAEHGRDPANLVRALFRSGDEGERVSLVRALCLIADPCTALATAREAGRINSLRLYTALALDNPYPGACYDEHDFNGLVLKCLFNGLPMGRVLGLAQRTNPALSRLCEDYREERVLAGRSVPPDIWLALVPFTGQRGLALAIEALDAEPPLVRRYAALALSTRREDARVRAALDARLRREHDPDVMTALTQGGTPAIGLQ